MYIEQLTINFVLSAFGETVVIRMSINTRELSHHSTQTSKKHV